MLGLCWTRSGVQIKPLLGLAVADTANPYRLASSQRLQDGGSDVLGNRQRDAVGALNVVAVPQAQHPREAALIADEEPSGTGLEQSLPGIRRLDHAGEELGVEAYDLPGESRRRGASRGLLTRARRRSARLIRRRAATQRDFAASPAFDQCAAARPDRLDAHTRHDVGSCCGEQRAPRAAKQRVAATVLLREYAQQTQLAAHRRRLACRRDRSARSEKMRRADAPRVLGLRIALRNHDRRGAEPA